LIRVSDDVTLILPPLVEMACVATVTAVPVSIFGGVVGPEPLGSVGLLSLAHEEMNNGRVIRRTLRKVFMARSRVVVLPQTMRAVSPV
jgi:hypothetical protein